MRVLLAINNSSASPKAKALVSLVEQKLKMVVCNSYELLVRDQNQLVDHLYDFKDSSLRKDENRLVSTIS